MASDYMEYPPFPYKGRNWHLTLRTPKHPRSFTASSKGIFPAKEVLINAAKEVVAQRAADLIHSARLAIEGSLLTSVVSPGEQVPIRRLTETYEADEDSKETIVTCHIPWACLIAARASRSFTYEYALAKLRLSLETFSVPTMYLDPSHSGNLARSPIPFDHIRLGFAITMAYSCIEELHCEIRASSQRPSTINGEWNPAVLTELEERLRSFRIDLSETFPWSVRGGKTLLEKKRPPKLLKKSSWAWRQVRDGEMPLTQALALASFLRSKVTTHRSEKSLLRVLSAYDVHNVQFLARRLLLERTGHWRWHENRQDTDNSQSAS